MNLEQLYAALQAQINGTQFTLPSDETGFESLTTLLDTFLPQQKLAIGAPILTPADEADLIDHVLVEGTFVAGANGTVLVHKGTGILSGAGIAVAARFEIIADQPQLRLTVTLPDDWVFSQSFGDLGLFDTLDLAASAFVLASSNTVVGTPNEGLNFAADLGLSGLLEPVLAFVSDAGIRLSVAGAIGFSVEDPDKIEMALGASVGVTDMGFLQNVSIDLQLVATVFEDDDDVLRADTFFRLATAVPFDNTDLALATTFEYNAGILFFEADAGDAPLASLDALTSLVNDADLGGSVDDFYLEKLGEASLALSVFTLAVTTDPLRLVSVSLGISSTQPLPVLDTVSIEDLAVVITVQEPSTNREISSTINGTIRIAVDGTDDVLLKVGTFLPDFVLTAGLAEESTIALTSLVEHFVPEGVTLPDGFPEILISKLAFSVDPTERLFSFGIVASGDWEVIPGVLTLQHVQAALSVSRPQGAATAVTGSIGGAFSIAGVACSVSAILDDVLVLQGFISTIPLSALLDDLVGSAALPDEVPDVELSNIIVSATPATGAFSISGTGMAEWEGQTAQVDLALNRTAVPGANGQQATSEIDCTITLTATGPFDITDELAFNTVNLAFTLDKTAQASAWSLAGDVAATVFDTGLHLHASYETAQGTKALTLSTSIAPALDVVSLDDLAALSLSGFSMAMTKAVAGGNGQAAAQSGAASSWSVSATGRVVIEHACDLAGTLTLFKKDDGSAGLVFAPTTATASVSLPIPDVDASLDLSFGGISVVRSGQPGSGWSFAASVEAAFKGLPGVVQEALPEVMAATFSADKDGARLALARVLDPVDFAFSNTLGTASIALTNLTVALGAQTDVSMQLGVGLPPSLNKLFGVEGNKAKHQIFRTYQEGDETSLVQMRLGMGPDGVSFTFLSSPLEAVDFIEEGAYSYFYADLGDCGRIKFRVPVFRYAAATSSFEANGGFEIVEQLQVPFGLFKDLLDVCGLGAAADALPDGVPVEDVALVDGQGRLKVDALIDFLGAAGDVPDEIGDALRLVGEATERLPDGFTDYLQITIPEALFFDIAVRPDGSMKGALRTYDSTQKGARAQAAPIRAIYPSMVSGLGGLPMPGFNGVQLRSVAFGPLAGGSLLQLEIDGRLDQYDMATLAASLMLPDDEGFPLPTSDQLQKALILDNVFMILPTALPIPIPVFYDEIGLEYLGLEGVTLQGHAQFPMPAASASALGQLFSAFKEFLEDRDALLNPNQPPGGVNLVFTLNGDYIQLPEYLGSGVLGTKGKLAEIDAYTNVAHLLNGLKTLSLNELIQAIPLNNRVGSKDVRFAFLSAAADWLITTPKEFRDGAFRRLDLSPRDRGDFLDVLPAVGLSGDGAAGAADEEGLVVFLRGEAGVGSVVTLETVFGLAASGAMGFNTGFKFTGTLAEFIKMELGGSLAINAPAAAETAPKPIAPTPALSETTPHALSFNGRTSCFKAQPFNGFPAKALTLEGWFKTDTQKKCALLSYANKETDNAFLLFNPANLEVNVNGAKVATGVVLNDGAWHHLAVTWALDTEVREVKVKVGSHTVKIPQEVTVGTVRVYKDGKSVYSGTIEPGKRIADGGALVLGQEQDSLGGGFNVKQAFKGGMDEVRLWSRVRTAAEIKGDRYRALSGREAGLVGYWPLDDGAGQTATDGTWRNHGALTDTQWVDETLPRSLTRDALDFEGLYLDGTQGRVVVASMPDFSTNAFTVECWIKSSDKSKKGTPLSYANAASSNAFLLIDHRNLEVLLKGDKVKTGVAFDDGQWHHLAVVWQSGEIEQPIPTMKNGQLKMTTQVIPYGKVEVYKDGKRVFNKSGVAEGQKLDGGGVLVFGQDQDRLGGGFDPKQAFKGTIQDVRCWTAARTQEQIRSSMARQLTGREKGLIGYWPLDEDAGTTAHDKTRNRRNGTITAGEWGRVDRPAVPDVPDSAAFQLQGYSRLAAFGHDVFSGDIRLVDDALWFKGKLDLFPGDEAFDLRGDLEGLLSPEKFYLAGDVRAVMAGLTLNRAQAILSHDLIRIKGTWLGVSAEFEASKYKGALQLKGSIGFHFDMKVDFGELGTLEVEVGASLDVTLNKDGFRATVEASAEINGKGVSVDFTLKVAPSDLAALKEEIKKRMVEDPFAAIGAFFEDAGAWLAAVGSDVIDWTGNAIEDVGQGLKDVYNLSSNGAAKALEGAGYAADEAGKALKGAFTSSTKTAAKALEGAGYAAEEVGKALKGTFTNSTDAIGSALKGAGFSSKEVGKALNDIGASAEDVAKFMKNVWGKGDDAVKDILKGAGYSSKAVEGAMKDVFNWGKDAWDKITPW